MNRPTVVTVFGVLSLIWSAFGLLGVAAQKAVAGSAGAGSVDLF